MSVNHLLREQAPISTAGWELLDDSAKDGLVAALGARKLVDFAGPHGWSFSATKLGRTEPGVATSGGVNARRRRVLPVTELRADFQISREELAANDRGAPDADLAGLDEAAMRIASAENRAVFHGWAEAGIAGITEVSPHAPIPPTANVDDYPKRVARAVGTLRRSGIDGPYALALSPDDFTMAIETSERGGYPLFDHLRKILGGPIVWVPGVRGAVVLSLRGGDFLFESGQDLALGYHHADAESVHLYLEESFTFRVATPEAAVELSAE